MIELNHPYKFKIDTSKIDSQLLEDTIDRNYRLLRPLLLMEYNDIWLTSRGTLPKRFFNQAHIMHIHYSTLDVSKINEIFSQIGKIYSNQIHTGYFEFSKKCNWKAGNFGESETSCWWGRYRKAKNHITKNGGYSILFYNSLKSYEKDKGIRGMGRCWAYPIGDLLYIFNGYGLELSKIAFILSRKFDKPFTLGRLRAVGAWINSTYIIGAKESWRERQINFTSSPPPKYMQKIMAADSIWKPQ